MVGGHTAKDLSIETLLHDLRSRSIVPFRTGIQGADLTTFGIGGVLPVLLEPQNQEELSGAISFLLENSIPYRVLGLGSNLLISDEGPSEWIIRLGSQFRTFTEVSRDAESVTIRAGGGASLMRISRDTSEAGLSGLEFAGGIPGSIGGGVRMNAGAHGSDISKVLESVQFFDGCGKLQHVQRKEISFGYRTCSLPSEAIVISADLRLPISTVEATQAQRRECLEERKKRQPLTLPSAGSVFRNPNETQSAGFLIESAGLKGRRIGGAMISEKHGNWIVNQDGEASASDVRLLIQECQQKVKEQFQIDLKPEVVPWGFVYATVNSIFP